MLGHTHIWFVERQTSVEKATTPALFLSVMCDIAYAIRLSSQAFVIKRGLYHIIVRVFSVRCNLCGFLLQIPLQTQKCA